MNAGGPQHSIQQGNTVLRGGPLDPDCELCGQPINGKTFYFFGKAHCESCMDYIRKGDPSELDS